MKLVSAAASSRCEEAVLVLETRKRTLTTKYWSGETVAGVTAPTITSTNKNKKNPARPRRYNLRLDQFNMKKIEEKKHHV